MKAKNGESEKGESVRRGNGEVGKERIGKACIFAGQKFSCYSIFAVQTAEPDNTDRHVFIRINADFMIALRIQAVKQGLGFVDYNES